MYTIPQDQTPRSGKALYRRPEEERRYLPLYTPCPFTKEKIQGTFESLEYEVRSRKEEDLARIVYAFEDLTGIFGLRRQDGSGYMIGIGPEESNMSVKPEYIEIAPIAERMERMLYNARILSRPQSALMRQLDRTLLGIRKNSGAADTAEENGDAFLNVTPETLDYLKRKLQEKKELSASVFGRDLLHFEYSFHTKYQSMVSALENLKRISEIAQGAKNYYDDLSYNDPVYSENELRNMHNDAAQKLDLFCTYLHILTSDVISDCRKASIDASGLDLHLTLLPTGFYHYPPQRESIVRLCETVVPTLTEEIQKTIRKLVSRAARRGMKERDALEEEFQVPEALFDLLEQAGDANAELAEFALCEIDSIVDSMLRRMGAALENAENDRGSLDRAGKRVLSPEEIYAKCAPAVFLIDCYEDEKYNTFLSGGSGFLVGVNGLALTCYHVAKDMQYSSIKYTDGSLGYMEQIICCDPMRDWALIRVAGAEGKPYIRRCDTFAPGETVYAIGCPEGIEHTMSEGLISSDISAQTGGTMIQISVPVSHGSSGGVLLNRSGEAIGITVGANKFQAHDVNYAVPISLIQY